LLIVLGACSDPGGNPLGGGGGPPTGDDDDDDLADAAVGTPDSGATAPDAAAVDAIVGRMCRADSLLAPEDCPAGANFTGVIAAHIEVSTSVVQADANGNFELPRALGGSPVATLRLAPFDANYRRSIVPIALSGDGTAGPMKLPVMLQEGWVNLTSTLGSADLPGDGAIVIYTVDGSAKLSGARVIGTDDGEIYYDNGAPLEWDQSDEGSGDDGVILITSMTSLLDKRTITLQQGTRVETLVDIPIESDAITFVTADFGD